MMENKPTFDSAIALTPCLPERKSLANAFDLGQELQGLLAETQMFTKPMEDTYTATLIPAKGVIYAPYQVRDKLQRESRQTLDSGSSPE